MSIHAPGATSCPDLRQSSHQRPVSNRRLDDRISSALCDSTDGPRGLRVSETSQARDPTREQRLEESRSQRRKWTAVPGAGTGLRVQGDRASVGSGEISGRRWRGPHDGVTCFCHRCLHPRWWRDKHWPGPREGPWGPPRGAAPPCSLITACSRPADGKGLQPWGRLTYPGDPTADAGGPPPKLELPAPPVGRKKRNLKGRGFNVLTSCASPIKMPSIFSHACYFLC